MPQMAPINWILLFLFFILCFYLFNTMNYYIYTPKLNLTKKMKPEQKSMNWKW